MPRPCGNELVVQRRSLFGRFGTGGVVGRGVELHRALGRCHQMEHRVVAIAQLHLTRAQPLREHGKIQRGHVSLVVQRAAIAHDEHLVRSHGGGAGLKHLFLLQLQLQKAFLKIQPRAAIPRRQTAADELGGRLRHEQHSVAQLGVVVLDPAHSRRLACTGTAGDHDFGNLHVGSSFFCTQQRLHRYAEQGGQLSELVGSGLGRAVFPFGDRLVGNPKPFSQLALGQAGTAAQMGQVVAEGKVVHVITLRLYCIMGGRQAQRRAGRRTVEPVSSCSERPSSSPPCCPPAATPSCAFAAMCSPAALRTLPYAAGTPS